MPTVGSGTNQIVPFATGLGANVESPANWLTDLVRQQGFQTGVANATQMNTVWRQASFIAAMIGQFTADYSGVATNDDGNEITAENNFIAALGAAMQPFGVYFLTDTGAGGVNQMIATTATNIPSSYSQVRLVVIKKSVSNNTGAMQVNYWGLGAVQLNDNTGTALQAGTVLGNSFYLQTFDGGGFRQLGTVTQTAGAGGVAANSGDAISVIVPNATVTMTIGTPGIVNWTAHGLAANTAVQFTTTGALLTGLTAFSTYYVTSPTTNNFNVAATPGGAAIAFSGTQSGTQTGSAIGAATVNFRVFLGTHDTVVNSGDGWPRAKAADGTARYMNTTEFASWINGIVTIPTPPTPFGVAVGQICCANLIFASQKNPAQAGMTLGSTYAASALTNCVYPGTNGFFFGGDGINGNNINLYAGYPSSKSAVLGVLTGTWEVVGWADMVSSPGVFGFQEQNIVFFLRIA